MAPPPRLSIITVVRDDPEGLAATAGSVAAQRWTAFEWLVADGGSGPATLAALAAVPRPPDWADSRPDGGPFDGMDRAMAHAQGDFLLFLNAGDLLADDDVLQDLSGLLAGRDADIFYGDTLEDPGDGRVRRKPARHWRWAFYGMPAHHCALYYRRALVAGLRMEQGYKVAGDYAFTLAALRRTPRVARAARVVARFAPGGLSRRYAALGRMEQAYIRQHLLKMPRILSKGIYLIQIVAGTMRHIFPRGYAFWVFR
ncbi:glycosyltransferase [Niveispirillum fermenti]|uniref:glycosyltransferase n=1 Tax=Niveispirillum fermenti TaxID=1233113 RepID=UPI003A849E15